MPEINPFRGIFYNGSVVRMGDVVAPPYDVISPQLQAELYERSSYNVVRLILGREADPYDSAAKHLTKWWGDQVLIRDDVPRLYVLSQTFPLPDGLSIERVGFIAACRLEDFGE